MKVREYQKKIFRTEKEIQLKLISFHCSYLKGAREGDLIEIDARAVKTGKTLAYLECELRNKANGQIIAKGSQTKFVATQ